MLLVSVFWKNTMIITILKLILMTSDLIRSNWPTNPVTWLKHDVCATLSDRKCKLMLEYVVRNILKPKILSTQTAVSAWQIIKCSLHHIINNCNKYMNDSIISLASLECPVELELQAKWIIQRLKIVQPSGKKRLPTVSICRLCLMLNDQMYSTSQLRTL